VNPGQPLKEWPRPQTIASRNDFSNSLYAEEWVA